MQKKWIITGIVLTGTALCLTFLVNQGEPVPAVQLHRQNVIATLTVTGEVQGDTTIDFSPPVTARITNITVDEGDLIQPGQLLVQLESDEQKAQLQQAMAQVRQSQETYLNLKQGTRPEEIQYRKQRLIEADHRIEEAQAALNLAEAQLIDARKNARRFQELFQQELVSAQENDNAQLQASTGSQRVEQAQATLRAVINQKAQLITQLTQAENGPTRPELAAAFAAYRAAQDNAKAVRAQVRDYAIHSNLYALVVDRPKDPGDLGRPGESILTVVDPHTLEVLCSVEENDLSKVQIRDTALVVLDAFPDVALKGKIKRLGHQVNQDNGTVEAHVTLLDSEWPKLKGIGLMPGMTADVSILTRRLKQALILPASAVKKEGNRWFVYQIQNQRIRKKAVQGERLSMENFRVNAGLNEGDWVATIANDTLLTKKKVHPAPPTTDNKKP
ncbi:efflux RND transporter periplasmic adaptor subunit [Vampirovibrio chlorellavorus]|uniref:efflux RND transporter periplasmic adaptor subunit n=1 Tax=Vampirovibrio chlorellavorus TaxID=758823 RepID=UPI0026EF474B|nr:HlyD family efflux transporter periplasmic adaptor subunit [Vampirovibrio chlorellavorus]